MMGTESLQAIWREKITHVQLQEHRPQITADVGVAVAQKVKQAMYYLEGFWFDPRLLHPACRMWAVGKILTQVAL